MKKAILVLVLIIGYIQLINCQAGQPLRYKNRIGLTGGGGSGFKYLDIVELTDGSIATISFGGGSMVQFSYGVELGRHFDLAVSAGGQFSKLTRAVSNASMNLTRSRLSVTPSYIVPISGGENMRLKIGAGFDLMYAALLTFDLSKLPGGVKDEWKYNNAFGEHLSIIFEYNTPKRLAFSGGLKLNNAAYKFKSGTISYPSSGADLEKPNGSSVDCVFGLFYTFNWKK